MANSIPQLAASFIDTMEFVAIMVFMLYVVLASVWLVLDMRNKVKRGAQPPVTPAKRPATPAPKPVHAAKPAPSPPPAKPKSEIEPELLAAISAAVFIIAGARARIQRIRLVDPAVYEAWVEHGRTLLHESHRIRRGIR